MRSLVLLGLLGREVQDCQGVASRPFQVVAGRKGLPEVDIWHCVIDLEGVAFLFSTFQQSSSLIERRRLVRMLEDILFEILARLPVKSLLRCRCVCQS
ncbi:unnamed protein product [Prunus armeniaca]